MREPDNLAGMNPADAKEYIISHIITLKLTRKKIDGLNGELEKWRSRAELARSKGAADLAAEAVRRVDQILHGLNVLTGEYDDLKSQIETMRRQLPGLCAGERSIDAGLLEDELLIALGYNPGDWDKLAADRKFAGLERDLSAEAALESLKEKMKNGTEKPETGQNV